MHIASLASSGINSVENFLDRVEDGCKTRFGDDTGFHIFRACKMIPFIHAEIVLSGVIDHPYVNTALGAFLLAKVIKKQFFKSVIIAPQTDQLICDLMATRLLSSSAAYAFCIDNQCQLSFFTLNKAIHVGIHTIAAIISSWVGKK